MLRRKRLEEPGLLDLVLDIAWASPLTGVIVSAILLLIASVIQSVHSSTEMPMVVLGPIIALMLAMVGIGGLLVSGIAFLRDALFGRR